MLSYQRVEMTRTATSRKDGIKKLQNSHTVILYYRTSDSEFPYISTAKTYRSFVLGSYQMCSGATPGFRLRIHFWWCLETLWCQSLKWGLLYAKQTIELCHRTLNKHNFKMTEEAGEVALE